MSVFALYQYLIYTTIRARERERECALNRVSECECERNCFFWRAIYVDETQQRWDEIKLSKKTKTRVTCNWNILKKETKNSQSNSLKKQQKVQQTNLDPRRICGAGKTEGVAKKKKRYFCAIFYTSVEQSKRRNLKLRRMTHFGRYSSF